jgi:hypothetical protein
VKARESLLRKGCEDATGNNLSYSRVVDHIIGLCFHIGFFF